MPPMDENDDSNISGEGELLEIEENTSNQDVKKDKKIFKTGIVYMSFIPPGMTPTLLRNLLTKYAPVGRLYLQEVKEKRGKVKRKEYKSEKYTEAWVEFLKKRHAKLVSELLNNTKMGGKKKSKFHDYLWNLKYLPRFKWVHLVERLNYESAVIKQRMRNEISQAKKIAGHFKDNVDKEERIKRKKRNNVQIDLDETKNPPIQFYQKESAEEIIQKKKKQEQKREDFLKNLFA